MSSHWTKTMNNITNGITMDEKMKEMDENFEKENEKRDEKRREDARIDRAKVEMLGAIFKLNNRVKTHCPYSETNNLGYAFNRDPYDANIFNVSIAYIFHDLQSLKRFTAALFACIWPGKTPNMANYDNISVRMRIDERVSASAFKKDDNWDIDGYCDAFVYQGRYYVDIDGDLELNAATPSIIEKIIYTYYSLT